MRDENNRNTLPELIYLEYETKRRLDEEELIPKDDVRDVNTYTTQSLSSEEADHSGYDQNVAAPADAKPPERMNPDHSAISAWEAAGAAPDKRTIAGERTGGYGDAPAAGREPEADGRVPRDRNSGDAAFAQADDANAREWREIERPGVSRPGDEVINEYAGDPERRVAADAALTGSGTAFLGQDIFKPDPTLAGEEAYDPLPDVPDADAISKDSPVDPAAPPTDQMHGIDLLNGSNGEEEE